MEDQPSAPPVVTVVVADSPGDCFERTLGALAGQDYPNQSVLVLDAGKKPLPLGRVAAVLPAAFVRQAGHHRSSSRPEVPGREDGRSDKEGFTAAANDVLTSVEGATYLLFCHDDVALEPSALSLLVDEALRSNAGIVAPKIVEWDRPTRLLDVGLAVDKTGTCASLAESGELDQEQRDAVRDVFAVSTTAMLVRSDLFTTLGGFDSQLSKRAAGVDLCWRAQMAGARVLVAPQARARHRGRRRQPGRPDSPTRVKGGERQPARHRAGEERGAESRGSLRVMLKCYSLTHLVRVIPQAAVLTVVEILAALATRRWSHARHLISAWTGNLRSWPQLRPLRAAAQAHRGVPDSELRRLQARGSVRVTRYLARFRAEERAQALIEASGELVDSVWRGPARAAGILLGVLTLAIVLGSRGLISGPITAVGDFATMASPTTFFGHYFSGWRSTGLGSPTSAPPAFAILGLLGGVFLGQVDLMATVMILAAWPLAGLGAWRLTQPLQRAEAAAGRPSSLARVVGLVAYLAMPLPYNAVARGQWGGLVAYAVFPWLLARLLRLSGLEPFGPAPSGRAAVPAVLTLGLVAALAASFAPSLLLALTVAAIGLVLGSVLVGQAGGALRALAATGGAVATSAVLLMPWTIELGRPGGWSTVVGVARGPELAPGLGQLLRFQVGPMGAAPLGWAFLAVAGLALVLGRGWRLAWAVRLWMGALACVATVWLGARGWGPLRMEAPDVFLAAAAAMLALSAAIGASAFEVDLRGYRFGWRQGASVVAGGLLVLTTLPVVAAVGDGRWNQPEPMSSRGLAWLDPDPKDGAFRVLWVGDPADLPLDGWPLGAGLAYATSRNGGPSALDLWPGPPAGATSSLADALDAASAGGTARLGRLLAPMAIRYVVVPRSQPTAGLEQALGTQLDLRALPSQPALTVYRNESWGPGRGLIAEDSGGPELGRVLGAGADLSGVTPVLSPSAAGVKSATDRNPARVRSELDQPGVVLLAESPSPGWRLQTGSQVAPRSTALGVMNSFSALTSGPARLDYRPSLGRYLVLAVNAALWVGAVWLCLRLSPSSTRRHGDAASRRHRDARANKP